MIGVPLIPWSVLAGFWNHRGLVAAVAFIVWGYAVIQRRYPRVGAHLNVFLLAFLWTLIGGR